MTTHPKAGPCATAGRHCNCIQDEQSACVGLFRLDANSTKISSVHQHVAIQTQDPSRIAFSPNGDVTQGIDGKDNCIVCLIHIRKSLIPRIIFAQVIHIAICRIRTGKEVPLSGKRGQIAGDEP